jgi:acyl-lipid omega-6 desaturase (Delta-12 desaturase)
VTNTTPTATAQGSEAHTAESLMALVSPYGAPIIAKSVCQLATSIGLFLLANASTYWSLRVSYFLTLALAIPTGALLVRVFIVQHDCGHGAFFVSRRANNLVGVLCSLMTFTPYANWRRQHAGHHGNWNNLDRRASGADIYSACLTVNEYRDLAPWDRVLYRLSRHAIFANLLLPPLIFLGLYRVPFDTPVSWGRERRSVYWTNFGLLILVGSLGLLLGFEHVLLVQAPIIAVASIIGVWLFTAQHRFETVRWMRQSDWNFTAASLEGSSFLRLPRVLQWFTGNIGFHHIHHLDPRVPNYRLEECCKAVPALQAVPAQSLSSGLRALRLALWDEEGRRMIGFSELRALRLAP